MTTKSALFAFITPIAKHATHVKLVLPADPYDHGYETFLALFGSKENPHPPGSKDRASWERGFNDAQLDSCW